jgi:hypothetical protein
MKRDYNFSYNSKQRLYYLVIKVNLHEFQTLLAQRLLVNMAAMLLLYLFVAEFMSKL